MAADAVPLPPARMLVYADEFFFNGSRRAGPSGLWRIQLKNNGEDVHDLAVRRAGGATIARGGIVLPGQLGNVKVRLRPGRYVLFCTITDHQFRGMKWGLRVVKPRVRTTAP